MIIKQMDTSWHIFFHCNIIIEQIDGNLINAVAVREMGFS